MQEYTQEKVDHAEHMGIAIPADVKEQIFEYANLIGDSNTNEPKTTRGTVIANRKCMQ